MKRSPVRKHRAIYLFCRIGFFSPGKPQEIIGADTIKFCKFYNGINRIIQNTHLILGVCVLTDSQIFRNLFLGISPVDPQTPDILILHDLISHIITR